MRKVSGMIPYCLEDRTVNMVPQRPLNIVWFGWLLPVLIDRIFHLWDGNYYKHSQIDQMAL